MWAQDEYLQYKNDEAISDSPQHVEIIQVPATENELFELVAPASYNDERGILRPDRLNTLLTQSPEEKQQALEDLTEFTPRDGFPVMDTAVVVGINTDLLFASYSELQFRVPWSQEIQTVRPKILNVVNLDHWTYYGALSGDEGQEVGYLLLLRREGKDFGRLITDKNTYLIQPLNEQNQSIIMLDNRERNNLSCGHDELIIDSVISKKIVQRQNRNSPTNEVRLLVLYTAAAEAIWDPDISATGSVVETQIALLQSDVQTSDLNLIHVGTERLDEFIESGNSLADVERFPVFGTAPIQRADNEADIVVLLTDDSYRGVQGRVTSSQPGDPTLGTNPTTGNVDPTLNAALQGCAFVVINSPGERQTFSHEVGHLFGGQHEKVDVTNFVNVAGFAFGHEWRRNFASPKRASLMRSGPGLPSTYRKPSRVLYFSNPDVTAWGEPTGVTDTREMDEQLRAQVGGISCYFVSPPPLQAFINGPSYLSANQNYTYTSTVQNCGGQANYLWETSRNFGSYEFLTSNPTASFNSGVSGFISLRLTISCNGEEITVVKTILVGGFISPCGQDIPCFQPQSPSSSSLASRRKPSQSSKSVVQDRSIALDYCQLNDKAENVELLFTNPSTGGILSRLTDYNLSAASLNSLARNQGISGLVLVSIISQEGVCSKMLFINNRQ